MNHFSNCKRGINVHFNFYSCRVDYEFLLYNWSLFYFRKKHQIYFCWPPQLLVFFLLSPFFPFPSPPKSPGYRHHPGPPTGGNETTIFAVRGTQSPLDVMQDLYLGWWRGLGEICFFGCATKTLEIYMEIYYIGKDRYTNLYIYQYIIYI